VEEVNRDGKNEHDKDPRFHDRFQRVKGISRKWTGIGRFMMDQVNRPEYRGIVHQPVHPVKISIVHDGHNRESNNKIDHTMLFDIGIKLRMFCHFRAPQHYGRDKGHDENGKDGINDLPAVIIKAGETLLDLFGTDHPAQQNIAKNKSDTGKDEIAGPYDNNIFKIK
jgi:hypothetical protein